ncbi:MAG: M23 family metallopeptidase, partial [Alphaproteobacteria bacterium]|nr:M23 family metallopeptidase [Alphaproteobacteria bacterium]
NYRATSADLPLKKAMMKASGKINGSLYEAAVKSGVPASLLGEIIEAYSYDVDFQRDIQPGDKFQVLFERYFTEDGKPVRDGNIIYASLAIQGEKLNIYRYETKDKRSDYYDEKGVSIRKPLLKTPIDGARLTSGFGMRTHPIMGYSKMHRGVDFGASTGTPIYAAGDGTVMFAGRKGGYGNYLLIGHNNEYATAYAHISRFAPGIRNGKSVSQRQVIAYVGSTGASTGPHLHYEVLRHGKQVNPVGVKFPVGKTLKGSELLAFKKQATTLESVFASEKLPSQVAELSKNVIQ